MYDTELNQLVEAPKAQMLDKDYFKCTCKKDDDGRTVKVCKNCADWYEYKELDENEWWDGS